MLQILLRFILVDVERITNGLSFFYSLLKFILVTTIGMITLWSYFGAASLGVLLSLLVVCAAIPLVSQRVLVDQTLWSKGTDARVKLITSVSFRCSSRHSAHMEDQILYCSQCFNLHPCCV